MHNSPDAFKIYSINSIFKYTKNLKDVKLYLKKVFYAYIPD